MNGPGKMAASRPPWSLQALLQRPSTETILQSADGSISIGEFMHCLEARARTLPNHKYVINLHRNRHEFLTTFCASVLRGQCTLMPANRQQQTLAGLKQTYPDCYQLGGESGPSPTIRVPGQNGAAAVIPDIPLQQVCAIAFTSGSTGKPSPNIKTWHMLLESTRANCEALLQGWTGPAHVVATVPSQHMWGFETSVLMPLITNFAISPANPLYPLDIVSALRALPAPRMLVSSPLHLQTLMKSGLELPEMSRVFTATAPLSQELAIELETFLGAPVLDVFGSSETGIIATRRTALESSWSLSAPFSIDMVQQKARVSAAHLPAPVFLADRLELEAGNRFRWLARENDQVNVAGKRASLAELNRLLLAIEGVHDGMIFLPDGQQRLAAVVAAPDLNAADIRQALLRDLDPVFIPRPMVFVSKLPRNETGKLPQSAVQAVFNAARQTGTGRISYQADPINKQHSGTS